MLGRESRKRSIRGASRELYATANALRRRMTPAEVLLWKELRGHQLNGLKFRRQHPVGNCILDFYCAECRLVIELDGALHLRQRREDALRTAQLQQFGLHVVRFRNEEVMSDLTGVLERIANEARVSRTMGR